MTDVEIYRLATKVWKTVERDLRDRRGIRHEWNACDPEIQQEIEDTNKAAIAKVLKGWLRRKDTGA